MRVAVTGWNGNIGRLLVKKLESSGIDLIKVGRQEGSDYHTDLSSIAGTLEDAPYCDVLVLLAWYTDHPHFWVSPLNEIFVKTSVWLANKFKATNPQIRLIGAGSCAELYSDSQNKYDLGFAKRRLRHLLQDEYEFPTTWFQIFFAYGPGEPDSKILSIIKHNDDPLKIIKEPGAVRDFIHFDEIAQTIEASIKDAHQGCFHLGNGYGFLIEDLIQYKLSGVIPKKYPFSERADWPDFKVADPAHCWPKIEDSSQVLAWLRS